MRRFNVFNTTTTTQILAHTLFFQRYYQSDYQFDYGEAWYSLAIRLELDAMRRKQDTNNPPRQSLYTVYRQKIRDQDREMAKRDMEIFKKCVQENKK